MTAVSAFDGDRHSMGFSCAFEIPKAIVKFLLEGQDLGQASNSAGFADDPELGSKDGLINIMSKGRVTRCDYTK